MFKKTTTPTTMEYLNEEDKPIVYMSTQALMKMQAYVSEFDKEISWLGTVESIRDNNTLLANEYLITDVFMFPQEVTATTTEMIESALNEFGTKLIQEGKIDMFNQIKAWGHSHVNMAVSPSGTDDDTFYEFYKDADFFIRMICNKKDEIRVDIVESNKHIMYMNVEWYEDKSQEQINLERMIDKFNSERSQFYELIKKGVTEEIKENIKYPVYKGYNYYTNKYDDDTKPYYNNYNYMNYEISTEKKTSPNELYLAKCLVNGEIKYKAIESLFDKHDILIYAETFSGWEELKEDLRNNHYFRQYNKDDWEILYDMICDYYFDEMYDYGRYGNGY